MLTTTQFCQVDSDSYASLADTMNNDGFVCIANFFTVEQLAALRALVSSEATRHSGQYFAYHDHPALRDSLLGALGNCIGFRSLLEGLYLEATGTRPSSVELLQVLRCVQGRSGRKQSNAFHYDASLVTVLVPIDIPDDGEQRGDLLVFPNLRRVRPAVWLNLFEKVLLQNALSRKFIVIGINQGWLNPLRLKLEPGNIYLFWGYRSLHANEPCNTSQRRATAIFHYGDPHTGSLTTRLILALTQYRARKATRRAAKQSASAIKLN